MTVQITIKVPKELDKKVIAIIDDPNIYKNAVSMFETSQTFQYLPEGETTLTIWGSKILTVKETPG